MSRNQKTPVKINDANTGHFEGGMGNLPVSVPEAFDIQEYRNLIKERNLITETPSCKISEIDIEFHIAERAFQYSVNFRADEQKAYMKYPELFPEVSAASIQDFELNLRKYLKIVEINILERWDILQDDLLYEYDFRFPITQETLINYLKIIISLCKKPQFEIELKNNLDLPETEFLNTLIHLYKIGVIKLRKIENLRLWSIGEV